MTGIPEDRWINVEEAYSAMEARLGLRQGLFPRPTDSLSCREGGMMWFADRAILVHETPHGFGFDRREFEEILRTIEPVQWPPGAAPP
ncbi:MAG TPA: hypothetical protein VKG23_07280 [Thermoanaerobaculia bacterium]|nr:hypothetical protein [Thermoanaerobaculia bacterium]